MSSLTERGITPRLIKRIAVGAGTVATVLALGGSIKSTLDATDFSYQAGQAYASGDVIDGDMLLSETDKAFTSAEIDFGGSVIVGIPTLIALTAFMVRNQRQIQRLEYTTRHLDESSEPKK